MKPEKDFSRSIEIIGEASKKVSADIETRYPEAEWKAMMSMRDRLVHEYFGVDYDIAWDVVQNKIPSLHKQIVEIFRKEKRP